MGTHSRKTQFCFPEKLRVVSDGDTIVVGTYRKDAAFVFVVNIGGGEWTLQQKLTPGDAGRGLPHFQIHDLYP
jgi:hypothetical protein